MATVWRARDKTLGRPVAIKRLLPHLASDPSAAQRFRREARAAAALSHPGIVTVFDTGEDDDGPFIVLELIEGQTVAERLSEQGPFDPSESAAIVNSVASALDHAHSNGVVHRDIKPSNLILDHDGQVRLADFGIARTVEDPTEVTTSGELVGTVTYMAPEILMGEPPSPASDIYSLAAVTHEMLTGTPPYQADNVGALLQAIRDGEPSPMKDVPVGMAEMVRRAMARNPTDRPGSAEAFAAGLVANTTLPIASTPAPPGTQAGSEEPTVVMAGTPPAPESNEGRRWSVLLGVSLIGVALLIWAAMAQDPGIVATDTSLPAAAVTSTVATSSTVPATTSTSTSTTSTTTTSTTVPTTVGDTPESIATAMSAALEEMQPPEFRPRDVSRVEDALREVMEGWFDDDDQDQLGRSLERLFERVVELPDSAEREEMVDWSVQLAESMGFEVDGAPDDGDDGDDGD